MWAVILCHVLSAVTRSFPLGSMALCVARTSSRRGEVSPLGPRRTARLHYCLCKITKFRGISTNLTINRRIFVNFDRLITRFMTQPQTLTTSLRKSIASLRNSRQRRQAGLFVIEGTRAVLDTAAWFDVEHLVATHAWLDEHRHMLTPGLPAPIVAKKRRDLHRHHVRR